MNINYNVNHKLLQLEIFVDKKGHQKRALLITLSCIAHFNLIANTTCQFYKGQMAADWDMSPRYFGWATKYLIDTGVITVIKPYDRKTQTAAIYALSIAYRRRCTKLYTPLHKAIDAASTVNNYKNNYKPKNDDSLEESHPSKKRLPWLPSSNNDKQPE